MSLISCDFSDIEKLLKASKELWLDVNTGWTLTSLLKIAEEKQREATARRFSVGGTPPWEDISYITRKRRKVDRDAPPLTDTSSLRNALTGKTEDAAIISREEHVGSTHGVIKLTAEEPRALALQEPRRFIKDRDASGKWNGEWKAMPARPFMYFDSKDVTAITKRQKEYISYILSKLTNEGWRSND